uniref:hypothetical protein n=1 Tax=Saccharibacillus sp. CPCC 101409 TaxID=3058041 RepID=UPI002673D7AA|nr:hypothetical protein [Saccharibacillus sp. CPCC 101409]
MNLKKITSLFFVIGFTSALIVGVGGCTIKNEVAGINVNSTSNELEPLKADIYRDEKFVFGGLQWNIEKEKIIKEKHIENPDIPNSDLLMSDGDLDLEAVIRQDLLYNFQDDRLVSGEYLFFSFEREPLERLILKLKDLLSSDFPQPLSSDFSLLNEPDKVLEEEVQITWKAEDESYLRLNVLQTARDGKEGYLVQIKVDSPLIEKNMFKP